MSTIKTANVAKLQTLGSTKTAMEWAEEFCVTDAAVRHMAGRYGVTLKSDKNTDFWTEARVVTLRKLAADGLSASQIARELKAASRAAVLGKMRRLAIDLRGKRGDNQSASKRLKAQRSKPEPQAIYSGDPRTSPLQKRLDVVTANTEARTAWVDRPESAGRVTIAQLQAHHCRWPIGDPSADTFRLCGDDHLAGSPYCAAHHRRAYTKPPTPPKELVRSLRRYA